MPDESLPEEDVGLEGSEPPSTLLGLLNIILRRFRWVAFFGFGTGIAAILVTVALGPRYRATSAFVPKQTAPSMAGLSGVAAQFGLNLGQAADGTPSISTYQQVLLSRDVLLETVTTEYRVAPEPGAADTVARSLVELYELDGTPTALQDAIDRFRTDLSVRLDLDANMVTIQTTASTPEVAEQANRKLLDLTSEFNLRKRQTEASAERTFIEERLVEVRRELDKAEAAVEEFLRQNRRYQDSPELVLEFNRLQRRVNVQQQVYLTLSQAREEARVEEMRNTPVITMIETPEGGAIEVGGKARNGFIGGVLGGFLGIAIALLLEYAEVVRLRNPEDYTEFARLTSRFTRRRRSAAHGE